MICRPSGHHQLPTIAPACCAILEAARASITFNGASFPLCYGIQFAEQPRNRNTIYSRPMRFDMICEANGIEHRLTKPNHLNRTIKDATVKRFHYDSHDKLRTPQVHQQNE